MLKKIKLLLYIILVFLIINPITINLFLKFIHKDINEKISKYEEITSTGEQVDNNELDKLDDSTLKYEIINFDSNYYPYYSFLNDNEKKLYNQIYANANALQTVFKPDIKISIDELKNTFEALYNDHPELFWVNTSYKYRYTEDKIVVQLELSFNDTSTNIDSSKNIFNTEVNKIIKEANKYSTNYDKEKYVYDYLVTNVKYDINANNNQSAYSAIVNKKTICAGYSRAFQYIMNKLNIPTFYVTGMASEEHAWNIIKLDDGYYNVDLTWGSSKLTRYTYFNKPDSGISSTHTRNGLSVYLPKCLGTKYIYYVTNNTNNKVINSNTNTNINTNTNSNSNIVIIENSNVNTNSNTTEDIIVEDSNINVEESIDSNTMRKERRYGRNNERVYP